MKKFCLLSLCVLVVFMATARVDAQGSKQGPIVARDADLEKDSLHNLEVARQYFTLRKAYVAALQRCEEIVAGNPAFSKMDETLYIAGKSTLFLAEGKGRQNASLYKGASGTTLTAEEFREEARGYFAHLVQGYPQSKFKAQAEDELKILGPPKAKESKQ
jgi:outer membrane protein assembly factor BamD (BamD/ComL family)